MIDLTSYPDDLLFLLRDKIKEEINSRRKQNTIKRKSNHKKEISPESFGSESGFNKAVSARNSSDFFSLPYLDQAPHNRVRYLHHLINQDWSHLFQNYEDDSDKFYVYSHVDPFERVFSSSTGGFNFGGTPFYIGKGTANRAWDLKRNQGHGKKIRELIKSGASQKEIVYIAKSNLSERQAMELESKLIYFFGTVYEREKGGCLYNLDISIRPEFVGSMQRLERNHKATLSYYQRKKKQMGASK